MAIARTPAHTPARWHYARLLVSPTVDTAADSSTAPIDVPTLLQLVSRCLQDCYGTMGGPVGLSEVNVVCIEEVSKGLKQWSQANAREVVIRFPAGATHALLTALPFTTSPSYRLESLADSSDLSRLAGSSGRGKKGYDGWVRGLKERVRVEGSAGEAMAVE
ncbi:Pyridoxal-5'-phosphate-dependent protein beta subunit [Rhodotorula toruloides ATCC 204091]|uniref:Pyridoxal-5'-phosphate-dependent protein beta subunit n=1 Tax=Rhodotorula toruloides TaxID=5286 RepID=A0A0K3CMZ6_RHOTO|nr:Pyridoxal-5'-phosphate-dependent protein beta subunit [Rhodotorula toruloides ATCC 204091]KAK4330321.1 Pyridoxal-5'-phosphate-dependent protein beta subunit [Rhodotorula toruloides]PRQ70936.1 pyridoxal-5'-phosphate-dependent protein beta subunit [Rhodotorula toruloides]